MVLGGANCVLLKILKNSGRNSRSSRSLAANLVLLNKEKSKLFTPSERSRGSTRGSVPKVKSGGAIKQEELNHRSALGYWGCPTLMQQHRTRTKGSRTQGSGGNPRQKEWCR